LLHHPSLGAVSDGTIIKVTPRSQARQSEQQKKKQKKKGKRKKEETMANKNMPANS